MEKRFYTCIELDRASLAASEGFEWDQSILKTLDLGESEAGLDRAKFTGWKCAWMHPDYDEGSDPKTDFTTLTNVTTEDNPEFAAQWFYYSTKCSSPHDGQYTIFVVNLPDMGITIANGLDRFNVGTKRVTLDTPKSEVSRLVVEGYQVLMEAVRSRERRDALRANRKLKLVI